MSARNRLNAVQVAMEQIAGLDFQPADFDRRAEFNDVNIGVRNGNAAGKQLKAQFFPPPADRAPRHWSPRPRNRARAEY